MKDFKIPFAVISFLAVQLGGAIWWASQVDGRLKNLETQSLNIAKENRRYIEQVDNVIVCAGQLSNRDLLESLENGNASVHLIGGADVASELDAKRAIDQGSRLAAKL